MKWLKARGAGAGQDNPGAGGSRGSGLLAALAILIPAAAIVVIGLVLASALDLRPEAGRERAATRAPVAGENPVVALPQYVLAGSPETQEAYRFALEQPEALQYIPCYCGCGGHNGHRSIHDCFLKQLGPDIVEFEEHGSGCGICVNIALDVKEQLAQGRSLSEIRSYVDGKYASIGPGTDTPLPAE